MRTVDLVDRTAEGASLLAGLRTAGMSVHERTIDDVPLTRADVVVLAGDAPGALDAIRRLRDDGAAPDTPVILLGTPDGARREGSGPGLGAQAVLGRPVALGALIDAIEQVLAPPSSSVSASRIGPRRERTMQLEREEPPREPTLHLAGEHATPAAITGSDPLREVEDLSGAQPLSRTPSEIGTGSSERPIDRAPRAGARAVASISDHLRDLLLAADRRAFPGRPPIDLSLPGGDEPAHVLVPNELLEHDDPALDAIPDEDPIDAFTFVGGPVLPPAASVPEHVPSSVPPAPDAPPHKKTNPGTPTSLSRRPAARATRPPSRPPTRPPSERPPAEAWEAIPAPSTGIQEARVRPPSIAPRAPSEWPSEDSVLGRITPDGGRRGSLAEGGALRLLMRIVELQLDARVSITPAGGDTVTLIAVGGELAAIEGPEASRALAIARRRDRSIPTVHGEIAARRALEDAALRGTLTALERDRALREGREELLRELVVAPKATFALARFEGEHVPARGPSPLAAPLAHAIVEAARRAIGPREARAILGGPVELRRGPRFEALAEAAVIAPELVALFARHDGETDARILDQAADEPGMPGLVAALVAGRALLASPAAAPEPAPIERARVARRTVEDAARVAEEGDYFAILGVAWDASERDVLHTYRRRVEALTTLPLDQLDLAALEPARRLALEALEEAHRVLSVTRWREAYATALAPAPPPGAPELAAGAAEH